jgi:hypothetical protein
VQFSPLSGHFIPLRPKYPPQQPVLKHSSVCVRDQVSHSLWYRPTELQPVCLCACVPVWCRVKWKLLSVPLHLASASFSFNTLKLLRLVRATVQPTDEGCVWRELNILPPITLIWFAFPLTEEQSFRTSWCQRIFHNGAESTNRRACTCASGLARRGVTLKLLAGSDIALLNTVWIGASSGDVIGTLVATFDYARAT